MNHLLAKYSTSTTAHDSRLSTSCHRNAGSRNICTRIARIPTAVRIDSTGNSHILTRSFESSVR
jgi:hypothetical protein